MTSETIAATILQLHRAGEPLNISAVKRNHPDLLAAAFACRPFLGWKQAVELAGLRYQDLRVELLSEVQCLVCGEYFGHLGGHFRLHGIDTEHYRELYPDAPMLSEELLAGLKSRAKPTPELPQWEPIWTLEYVLDRLWQYHLKFKRLNRQFISRKDNTLPFIIHKHGMSWDDAVLSLGLDPSRKRLRPSYTHHSKEEIIRILRQRDESGLSNSVKTLRTDDPVLLASINSRFLFFSQATEQAGLHRPTGEKAKALERYPTPASVIEAVRKRAEDHLPFDLHSIETSDYQLKVAITRHFDNHRQCLAAARLRITSPRRNSGKNGAKYPTSEAVISALRERGSKGQSLSMRVTRREDLPLVAASLKHFETWRKAIAAAGLTKLADRTLRSSPKVSQGYTTKSSIIEALRARAEAGLSVSSDAVRRDDAPLSHAVWRTFKSWKSGIAAARLSKFHQRKIQQSKNWGSYPDRKSIILALRQHASTGAPLTIQHITASHPSLGHAIRREFNSHLSAIDAAGLRARYFKSNPRVRRDYPDPDSVLKKLQELAHKGKPLSYPETLKHPGLSGRIYKYFGGIPAACRAAGVFDIYKTQKRAHCSKIAYPDPQSVIQALQKRSQDGLPLTAELTRRQDPGLHAAACRHFQKYTQAIKAA